MFGIVCKADGNVVQEALYFWDDVDEFGYDILEAWWNAAEAER